jgi:2,5-diketo-D-gluconate reductase B
VQAVCLCHAGGKPIAQAAARKDAVMIYREIGGVRVPALGLGTFGLTGEEGIRAVRAGLDAGYRHIDCAPKYGNEAEVGRALRESGIARDQLFVTTKVWHTDLDRAAAIASVEQSLKHLGLDHVDLLLVHWPNPAIKLAETLGAFAELQGRGLARLIGVSNFTIAMLTEALDVVGAPILANQVEYHPFLDQTKLLAFLRARGMLLTAYLPIARGAVNKDATLVRIAAEKGKSPAQIALRWLLQQDAVVAIPRSSRPERLRENCGVFDFTLSAEQTRAIDALRRPEHIINPAFAPVWDMP